MNYLLEKLPLGAKNGQGYQKITITWCVSLGRGNLRGKCCSARVYKQPLQLFSLLIKETSPSLKINHNPKRNCQIFYKMVLVVL